jgi:hypothetical protein
MIITIIYIINFFLSFNDWILIESGSGKKKRKQQKNNINN